MLLTALLIYWPALHGGLVLDDALWVNNSPELKSFSGLLSLWRGTKLPDFFPLTSTSFWLEWHLWDKNLLGFHLTNVMLHVASGWLFWLVLRRLAVTGAFVVALLFVVHPVNVESVAWITERKNTLCLFFYLLSVLWWLGSESESESGKKTKSRVYFALSLIAFLLALLSKTSVVTLPVILLGCVWWRKGKIEKRDWVRSLPYFGLSVALGLVTMWFQSHQAIGHDVVLTANFWARLAGAGWAVWFYLWKAVWPLGLAFVYPRWTVDPNSPMSYLPTVALAVIALVFWIYRGKSWMRPVLFALGYFLVTLAPILGFVDIYYFRYSMVADHWQYFSIIGVIALIVAGVNVKISNLRVKMILAAALAVVFTGMARQQAKLYGDPRVLWEDTLVKNPDSWMAHEIMGHYLGNTPEAVEHFKKSLQLNPNNVASHVNLGMILQNAGRLEEAQKEYEAAEKIDPSQWAIKFNLGALYDTQGKNAEAEAAYRGAIQINPAYSPSHNYLGTTLLKLGTKTEAIAEFQEALRLDPGNVEARENLNKALAGVGK